MKKNILVIGSLNADISISMEKMPIIGETVFGEAIKYSNGGKGANQACAIGRLGGNVEMLGCIGNDDLGKSQILNLNKFNIKTENLKKQNDAPTGTAVIYVDKDGKNSIVVIPGANNLCDVEYLKEKEECLEKADFIVLQLEIPIETVEYSVKKGKELGKTIVLNPAPAPEEISEEILQNVDYFTPNESELQRLAKLDKMESIEDVKRGAQFFIDKGVKNVMVTLGENGVLLVNKDGAQHFPAYKVKAIDTTAAGDCFNGAFVVGLSEGKTVEDSIVFANKASSIAVTRKGAQDSIPSRDEVEKV